MKDNLWRITSFLLGIISALLIYVYQNDRNAIAQTVVEAKTDAHQALIATADNKLAINDLKGSYNLLNEKLDYIIQTMKENGIRSRLPVPTAETLSTSTVSQIK